jgi:NAD(P)-dependent dehydrogenase (short-subunit alcohol dehydrogenase family)
MAWGCNYGRGLVLNLFTLRPSKHAQGGPALRGKKDLVTTAADESKFAELVRNWLVSLPQDVKIALDAMDDENLPRPVREIAAGVVAYVVSPNDFIQDRNDAVVSYADDALLLRMALTKALSHEFAPHNVLVNAMLVGFIEADQHVQAAKRQNIPLADYVKAREKDIPLGRIGKAEEFANLACFLASDAGGYITGTATNVDGGRSPVV